jgi:hypothetical protein
LKYLSSQEQSINLFSLDQLPFTLLNIFFIYPVLLKTTPGGSSDRFVHPPALAYRKLQLI